jgi:uncharacterized membrane protein (UPF0127 family)
MRKLVDLVVPGAPGRLRIGVADGWASRAIGLLATRRLDDPCGLWIKPCSSIHTFWMRYPIDVVFLDKSGVVVRVAPAIVPWRLAACRRAHTTLELRAGLAAALGLRAGMELGLR